jgi:hypothetical protein
MEPMNTSASLPVFHTFNSTLVGYIKIHMNSTGGRGFVMGKYKVPGSQPEYEADNLSAIFEPIFLKM